MAEGPKSTTSAIPDLFILLYLLQSLLSFTKNQINEL